MSKGLEARAAELLARHVNTAITTASGYGTGHPMSEKACHGLHQSLSDIFLDEETVTLMLDRGALFVEKHPVGQRFNPRRMINLLAQLRIESITFSKGLSESEVGSLMAILADPERYPDVEGAKAGLIDRRVDHIQLNYIIYRKITADQKVVSSDEEGAEAQGPTPAPALAQIGQAEDTFGALAAAMSLKELVRDPAAYAEQLALQTNDDFRRRQLVRQLRNLVSQVEMGQIEVESAAGSEQVLTAVNSLRKRLRKVHSTGRNVEVILAEEDQVLGEIDQLTYSTLVALVREEYRGGSFSPGRMAQIIHRMLPDARDLKRLLPQLKQGLLAEGMSVEDYAGLVKELSTELRGEHLVRALSEGADSVGLDVDEIVEQIREDPGEAARLIVMASELRRGGLNDGEQLSAAFSDYIERISEKLALGEAASAAEGKPEKADVGEQLARVQALLIDQLHRQGMPEELIQQLRSRLAGEPESPPVPAPTAAPAETRPDLPDRIPAVVLDPRNTAFFLNREIKTAQRYKNPFSVIKISIEFLQERHGPPRRPNADDMAALLPQIYALLIEDLRDLDLIGSLDRDQRATPLMILPMTPLNGAMIVRDRLQICFERQDFWRDDTIVKLDPTITAIAFDSDRDASANAYVQRMHAEHEQKRGNRLRGEPVS